MPPLAHSELGAGVVWWPPLDALCREGEGLTDVVEAEPESYWAPTADGTGFRSFLPSALAHLPQPKLLHGVGAPLAGTCPAPGGHAAALAAEVAALRPAHVSEHLNVSRFRAVADNADRVAGFFLPPLQSAAGVALAAANIRRRRQALGGVPLAVETPVSYLPPAPGEWPDGAFVAAVCEAADCGILLDLHNVLCNARNKRQSAAAFCDALPLERVWELHVAGGEREGSFYVDAHCGLADPELMEIAAGLVPRLPQLRAIIFEIMPERVAEVGLAAIARQLGQIRDLWHTRATKPRSCPGRNAALPAHDPPLDPETWDTLLGSAVNLLPLPPLDARLRAWWDAAAPALGLYRGLISEARASLVAAAAPSATRLLLQQQGGAATRRLLREFWRQTPQAYTAADEARAFIRFLVSADRGVSGLADAAAADLASLAQLCNVWVTAPPVAVRPPSTTYCPPVIAEAASEHRNSTVAAISSGVT
jgi:uncharacterized protein